MTSSSRPSNLWNVSYGPDGGPRKPVLPEEDDWFATPFEDPVETDEVAWQDDVPAPPPRPPRSELAQRQLLVVGAVIAIVVVVGAGFLVARSLGGSDDTTATPRRPCRRRLRRRHRRTTTPASTTPARRPRRRPDDDDPDDHDANRDLGADRHNAAARRLRSSVTSLQQALTQLGYEAGTADGTYGPATTAAVAAFQKAQGLTEDGIAGPTTLTAINTALAAG